MNLNAPMKVTWYIGIALAVISLISILVTIPGITDTIMLGIIPFAGLVLMLLAAYLPKL